MTDALKLHIRALYAQGEALQSSEEPLTFEEYEQIAWNMGFLYALQSACGNDADSEIAMVLEGVEQEFDKHGPVQAGDAWCGNQPMEETMHGNDMHALAATLTPETRMKESQPLPPDPDGRNHDRAAWAKVALDAFMRETGTDLEDALYDLLCDLMHLSDRVPFDFEAALIHAKDLYLAETGQPGPLTW
jgi:hypothetical protein